jgi:hypothetical protein
LRSSMPSMSVKASSLITRGLNMGAWRILRNMICRLLSKKGGRPARSGTDTHENTAQAQGNDARAEGARPHGHTHGRVSGRLDNMDGHTSGLLNGAGTGQTRKDTDDGRMNRSTAASACLCLSASVSLVRSLPTSLTRNHLENDVAEAPPVDALAVRLVLQHLGCEVP